MPEYTIKNVTTEAATLDEARWLAAVAYLRHIAGFGAPEPTEQEITALLAELETEETERLDLADLGGRWRRSWPGWTRPSPASTATLPRK